MIGQKYAFWKTGPILIKNSKCQIENYPDISSSVIVYEQLIYIFYGPSDPDNKDLP